MKTRRRTARRKFHALHPDFAFVALVAAALAAHVAFHGASPRGKNPVAGAVRAGKAGAATGLAVVFAETAPEALFDPVPRFADLTLPEKTSDASPPRDLALLPPPGSETEALLSPSVAPPDLPASVAKPSFPLSENPFFAPPPPVAAPPPSGAPARNGDVFVFSGAEDPFPVAFAVFRDASAEELASAKAAALESAAAANPTDAVFRASIEL